ADVNMINAIRQVTVERGFDPRDLSLLCYGGGGGLFAAALAEELQIGTALVPVNPAVFSAWGILNSAYREDAVLTSVTPLAELSVAALRERFSGLIDSSLAKLSQGGLAIEGVQILRLADMRYEGQEHTVRVPVPGDEELDARGLPALVE